ncbi:hypothetical protein E2493_06250 [Sphingomonas parva]|uniref:Uncharacterized protein n=1 Tax=Sphingomonas parva TaxID=2555898 RepID=A0A4Y8ZSY1_9SPHN|nr:hypothetical protein [Sphingomonas parva]TFI59123.1 hypothetical protein E2493_06250 [Sphingomonas parva]
MSMFAGSSRPPRQRWLPADVSGDALAYGIRVAAVEDPRERARLLAEFELAELLRALRGGAPQASAGDTHAGFGEEQVATALAQLRPLHSDTQIPHDAQWSALRNPGGELPGRFDASDGELANGLIAVVEVNDPNGAAEGAFLTGKRRDRRVANLDPELLSAGNVSELFQDVEASDPRRSPLNGREMLEDDKRRIGFDLPEGPLDPEGIGDIGFNQPGDHLPPGAQQFQREFQDRINAGQFATPGELRAFALARGRALGNATGFTVQQDDATLQKVIDGVRKGIPASAATPTFKIDISGARKKGGSDNSGQMVDAVVRGAADALSFGMADEIAAFGNTLFNGGTFRENLARERAIDEFDEQNQFGPRLAGQVGGVLFLPTRAPNIVRSTALGAARQGLSRAQALALARIAGARRAAVEGAAYGGAYGFGSAGGDFGHRVINGGASAAVGGAAGFGLGQASRLLPGSRRRVPLGGGASHPEQVAAGRAAPDLGVDPSRFIARSSGRQGKTSEVRQTRNGPNTIVQAGQKLRSQSRAAVRALARKQFRLEKKILAKVDLPYFLRTEMGRRAWWEQRYPKPVAKAMRRIYSDDRMGSHYFSRSSINKLLIDDPQGAIDRLWNKVLLTFRDSRFNVARGKTYGDTYVIHKYTDPRFYGARLPATTGRRGFATRDMGIETAGPIGRFYHGAPRPLKVVVGAPPAAAAGLYAVSGDDEDPRP